MQDYVLGIDIGGTNIKAGAIDYQGNLLVRNRALTEAARGVEAILGNVTSLVTELKSSLPDRRLKAIGFGIAGAVNSREGVVTQAPNVPAWDGLPVGEMLSDRLQVPCFIDNDANVIAVGEMWKGAGRGCNHICCLTLGTGVGGGVLIDGELLHGADGMAAELGHITVTANGARCNCGSYGCLETYASSTGILRILSDELQQNRESSLSKILWNEVTTALVYEHAKQGDALANEVLKIAGTGLGIGMATLINIFNPEVFILAGGVAAAWDLLMPSAMQTMKERAFKAPAARVKVVRAEKEDDAGVYGSAYIAWDGLQRGDQHRAPLERSMAPWGFWQVLEVGNDYKVKRIYVHPGHRLSYQKHQQREETWTIAAGEAVVVLDDREYRLQAGQTIHVGKTQAHRIGNPGNTPLIFLEVQRGTYFGEDDITRLQDDYKRS